MEVSDFKYEVLTSEAVWGMPKGPMKTQNQLVLAQIVYISEHSMEQFEFWRKLIFTTNLNSGIIINNFSSVGLLREKLH